MSLQSVSISHYFSHPNLHTHTMEQQESTVQNVAVETKC